MKKTLLRGVALLLLVSGLSTQAQVSQWVAFNDHFSGPNTGPNATAWNFFPTANNSPGSSGPLKDSVTGLDLPVTMTVTGVVAGAKGGTSSSGPAAGSPAALMFAGQVDFGTGGATNHAVQLEGSGQIVHAFSGLDPAKRYSWHGTAARGGNYADRWTLLEISAASWQNAHTMLATGLFVTAEIPTLTEAQAVANFGENRAPGALAGWTNIAPNPDGTILVYQSTYKGSLPAPFVSTGSYGYAVVADRLEEFSVTEAPVSITTHPQSITAPERGIASFSVLASGSPQNIQWYRKDSGAASFTAIPGATFGSYTIASAAYPADNGAQFRVVIDNSFSSQTSDIATLTVTRDTTAPVLLAAVGDPDLATVRLTFSEPLDEGSMSMDPLNFTLFERGSNPDASPYSVSSVVVANGTNVILTTTSRSAEVNYSISVIGVRDLSSSQNEIVPVTTNIHSVVQLVGFDINNEWKYDINNGDRFGSGWESAGFDDSAWPSGPAGIGKDTSANGVAIRTELLYNADSAPVYLRRHFNLPSRPVGVILTLRDVVEDGAVYFINGQEAYRHNVAAGTLTFASRAAGTQTDPTPIQGPFSLPTTNLVEGDNVIAVVVLQSGNTSSDIELAVELTATVETFANNPPTIVTQPQSVTVAEGQPAALNALIEGASPLDLQWRKGTPPDGVDVYGATGQALSFAKALPSDSGTYYLHASNPLGEVTTTVAQLTVTPDTTAPAVVRAVASANLTDVLVSFTEPIGQSSLVDPSDPSKLDTLSLEFAPTLQVLSATITNGTNVLIVTDPREPDTAYALTLPTYLNVIDLAQAQNALPATTVPVLIPVSVLPMIDSSWKWFGDGSFPGSGWQATGYADDAWPAGSALFEAKRGTVPPALEPLTRTTMSISNVANTTNVFTYYFRTHFNWSVTHAAALQISHYLDDGAVVFLNGQEIYRIGMTNAAPIDYFATSSRTTGDGELEGPFYIPLPSLVSGDNLLAVELHQVNGTSSDATMALALDALVTGFSPAGPRMAVTHNPAAGQITITWPSGVLQQTTALQGPDTVWTDVSGSPSSPYTVTASGGPRFFRVR